MRLHRLFAAAATGSALALAFTAVPAAASDGPPMPTSEGSMPSPRERDRWVQECSERLTAGQRDHYRDEYSRKRDRERERARERDQARASCESYYDDYYAYYRSHQAYGEQRQATVYRPSAQSYRQDCVPCDRPSGRSNCGQAVEYEYEYVDVPVRPRPSKRVRIVPDKRIRLK
jgi:hypothetical protein